MLYDQRPGTVYWIDHYVVGSNDLDRWGDFQSKVIGARAHEQQAGRFIRFQRITDWCHHGAMIAPEPLPPAAPLGQGLPRHGLYIRQADIDKHLARLDEYNVPHLEPIRTSADGEDGIAIIWQDPDGNEFEFWAPDLLPEGAMAAESSAGVGRISHVIQESQDLQRAADHFATYCAIEPRQSTDVSADTLVLRLVGGARVVYKKAQTIHQRTAGWGKLTATHAALVVRDEDFWPNYEKMWANVPEWEYDREHDRFVGAGPDLPARTARHGSPAGQRWFNIKGRGDDWYDYDTNCFHFMGGVPRDGEFSCYEGHTMEWHLPEYMQEHGIATPA